MFFKINFPTFKAKSDSVRSKSEKSVKHLIYIREKCVFLRGCTLCLYRKAAIHDNLISDSYEF